MDDIEKILRKAGEESAKKSPPANFTNVIKDTLKNKSQKQFPHITRRILAIAASIIIVCVGSISVYGALGGEIFGKPVFDWIKIKFPDEFKDYVVEENQNIIKGKTSLNLVSKLCDEGIVVLEFDLFISDEDKETLGLDKPTYNGDGSISTMSALRVSFNNDLETEDGKTRVNGLNNFNLIIDGEKYWIRPRAPQQVTKLTDNQYKIYQMYFLTEKELGNKTEFVIDLKDVTLCGWGNVCMPMDNSFKIEISKDKAVQNTKEIIPNTTPVTYKKMTKEINKVLVTPLQIIVKVTATIDDLSLVSLESTRNKDYIGINEYKARNQDGTELTCCRYETKRTVIYEDGTIEEWEQGDIGTAKEFENGQMILTEYVIIEKNEKTNSIKLIPTVRQPENGTEKEISLDIFDFEI